MTPYSPSTHFFFCLPACPSVYASPREGGWEGGRERRTGIGDRHDRHTEK
jgi:hypothetical protein